MRRAAYSTPCYVAEGYTRKPLENMQFLNFAKGSLEVLEQF